MTLRLAVSLIALTFFAGGVLVSAPAAADESGMRTQRSSVAKKKARLTVRNTDRYRAGYAAGASVRDSYARGYTDGLAARTAPTYRPNYVVYNNGYNNGAYVAPGYAYNPAPTVISPAYAYSPAPALIPRLDPITSALTVPVATAPAVQVVQGDVASWIRDCSIRYRQFQPTDFDPATGTFLGNDGDRYYCN